MFYEKDPYVVTKIVVFGIALLLGLFLVFHKADAAISAPYQVAENLICHNYDDQSDVDDYIERMSSSPRVEILDIVYKYEQWDGMVLFDFISKDRTKIYNNRIMWWNGLLCETTLGSRPNRES